MSASERGEAAPPPHITLRALLLGMLTIVVVFYTLEYIGQSAKVGGFVKSQVPMTVLVPFILWLCLNVALKWLWPRIALLRGELLTIFCMLWVVGAMPQIGWMGYWVITLAMPTYFATTENQWAETFFDNLPWHVFPDSSSRVIDAVWQGLPPGAEIPWDGWIGAGGQWLGVSLAVVLFGFCTVVLFQKQWEEREKLAFPLAQFPMDMTRGFDGPRCLPRIFQSPLFWIGFGVVFVPMIYNAITYFTPGLPPMEIYLKRYYMELGKPFPDLVFRLMPPVMAMTYLCPLDILGSLVFFHLLAVLKGAAMQRVGFELGAEGQPMNWHEVLHVESYGAMLFVGAWSIWLARGHLRQVWRQVRTGKGDRGEVVRYRLALIGLCLSAICVIMWEMSLGMSLPLAAGVFVLTMLVYLVIAKLIAATGYAYLLPDWEHMKGATFVQDLMGTIRLSPQSLVAFEVFSGRAFFGNLRVPAWPAMPHVLRLFSLREQPGRVTALVFAAFVVGFLVAAGAGLALAYWGDGIYQGPGGTIGQMNQFVHLVHNPRVPDVGRWGAWLAGVSEAAGLAFLRARFYRFPLHPVGLAFQNTVASQLYWFTLFLVWFAKLSLLRLGGVGAYRAGKPFFYGLGIGYVLGVALSAAVDVIWFPAQGHPIHEW